MRQLSACCVVQFEDASNDVHDVLLGFNHRKGGWENSGGRNEGNERVHETAIRELLEEVGFDTAKQPIQIVEMYNYEDDDGWLCVVFYAHCASRFPPSLPEPQNHSSWKWHTRAELKAIENEMTPACQNILRRGAFL